MSAIIAERKLDHDGKADAGFVRIFAPEPDQDDWRCAYEVAWPGYNRAHRVIGIDSWQALQLAMHIVPVEIAVSDDFKAGRIGNLGRAVTTRAELIEWLGLRPMQVLEQ